VKEMSAGKLSLDRKHEIAYQLVKLKVRKNGLPFKNLNRDAGRVTADLKRIGVNIKLEEILEFVRVVNLELMVETFD
jgi:hypothetical protein